LIYYQFDNIFSSMATKSVQVRTGSGRICNHLASRIRICITGLRIRGSGSERNIYGSSTTHIHIGWKTWKFRWYTVPVPTAVILVGAVETLRQAGALEVARNALTAHAPHLVRPASQLTSNNFAIQHRTPLKTADQDVEF
jgi:hypothetical protein